MNQAECKTIVAHADQARADGKEVVALAWEMYLSDQLERDAGVPRPCVMDFGALDIHGGGE